MAKVALLIGVSEYEPGLNPLPAAVKDVEAMQRVLVHPEMGGFAQADITVLKNPQKYEMETAIYELFADRKKDDLLLFYFSGHGITDQLGQFYLATRSTRKSKANQLMDVTAVAASFLHQKMSNSRSEQQVVILDCCFSGAFAKGMTAKGDDTVNIQTQLGGKGRAVLASSTSTQYSFEHKDSGFSIYTHYLREGIEQGKADGDSDGWISVDELHKYASDRVKKYCLDCKIEPPMTPEIYAVKEGYKIHLAKALLDDPRLKYRKEVEEIAREDEAKISAINRSNLDELRKNLKLSPQEAEVIESEVLEPYHQRRAKLQRYEQLFREEIGQQYPLSESKRKSLKRLQRTLMLRDEDVEQIERRVVQPRRGLSAAQLLTRQQFLKLAGLGGTGFVVAVVVRAFQGNSPQPTPSPSQLAGLGESPQPTPSPSPSQKATPKELPLKGFSFDVVTVDARGKEIKRSRKQAKFFTEDLGNEVSLEMVSIPGGNFKMGSPESEPQRKNNESPQHTVTVQPFFMGKFPVTQAQWRTVASFPKVTIDLNPDPSHFKGENRPVEQVSWYGVVEFCDRLSRKTGRLYRLPSEAEWEYACRAGTTTPFHFGQTISTDLANYWGEDRTIEGTLQTIEGTLQKGSYGDGSKGIFREQTTEVGSFQVANAFGLYDMHGNVWEWCADLWHDSYNRAPTDGSAWLTGNNYRRLLRGGVWDRCPALCRAAFRLDREPDLDKSNAIGFRVVYAAARVL